MYSPKIKIINLTKNKILPSKSVDEKVVTNFLGGRGITTYLGYESIPVDASPRGEDNSIIFGTGVLTGTHFPSSGTAVATFKSPHTNTLCTAVTTGSFGAFLKHSGFDFLQISGRAKSPQILIVDEFSDITFEKAEKLWKASIQQTDKLLRHKYGETSCIACVGEAATNQVAYAGVAVDRKHFFHRGGLGSVIASKNIKAIVFTDSPEVKDLPILDEAYFSLLDATIKEHFWFSMLKNQGTFATITSTIQREAFPTKNCSRMLKIDLDKISEFKGYGEPYNCWQCSIKCIRNSYQSFTSLGPNLKIIDHQKIQEAILKCDQEALDPLSIGAALASLFNIQEDKRKLLNIKLGYGWGDPKIYSLIEDITKLQSLGDQLSRGEEYLYLQTSEPSPMIKGQMAGMYYYPHCAGISIEFSSSPYGSNHQRTSSMLFPELLNFPYPLPPRTRYAKIKTKILFENLIAVLDSLVVCNRFLPLFLNSNRLIRKLPSNIIAPIFHNLPKWLFQSLMVQSKLLNPIFSQILGEEISTNTILEIGDRITLLERLFNTRSGNMRIKDQFKPFIEKRTDFFKSQVSLLTSYYQTKGLSPEGLVTMETLKKSKLLGMVSI
ncbi:MAG: aldehyde ferredoxin oxidoreductase N-terminal domain-containing protein [Candidatus Kariarchaeaceae archaeon]|jgi:aldehyde:ferredoxin oxidoreductase